MRFIALPARAERRQNDASNSASRRSMKDSRNANKYDVIVVGAGNAAFCAALAAQEQGATVLMLEAAPRGRSPAATAASPRARSASSTTASTTSRRWSPTSPTAEIATTDFGTYTQDQFFDDMARVTQHRADPDLVELLVTRSFDTLVLDARQGRALHPDLRPPGVQDRRQVQVLGRAHGRSGRRRAGPRQHAHRGREEARHRDPLPDARARPPLRRRPRRRRARAPATSRSSEVRGKAVVLACGGFEANPEWRTRYLGPGWDLAKVRGTPLQHRRRHPHGARHRRQPVRQLVGLPRGRLGDERARVRRPRGRRPVPEALLSVRHHGQRHRQALRRRGRRFPQLHLRQIRPRHPGAAGPVRLADLRPEGEASAARRIPHPPDHQGDRQYDRGTGQEARRRRRRRVRQDHRGVQRGGAHRHPVQSQRQGRPPHRGARDQQEQLGEHASTSRPTRPMR